MKNLDLKYIEIAGDHLVDNRTGEIINRHFVKRFIDVDYPNLTSNGQKLMNLLLSRYTTWNRKVKIPRVKELSAKLGVSKSTYHVAIKNLIERRYLINIKGKRGLYEWNVLYIDIGSVDYQKY